MRCACELARASYERVARPRRSIGAVNRAGRTHWVRLVRGLREHRLSGTAAQTVRWGPAYPVRRGCGLGSGTPQEVLPVGLPV